MGEHLPRRPGSCALYVGSTGKPKGVVHSQRTILARALKNVETLGVGLEDRVLSFNAIGTIAGLVTSMAAILAGARQYVVSATGLGASGLLSLVERERATLLWAVPSLVRMLLELDGASAALASLRLIRVAGEPLLGPDHEQWRAILPSS